MEIKDEVTKLRECWSELPFPLKVSSTKVDRPKSSVATVAGGYLDGFQFSALPKELSSHLGAGHILSS